MIYIAKKSAFFAKIGRGGFFVIYYPYDNKKEGYPWAKKK